MRPKLYCLMMAVPLATISAGGCGAGDELNRVEVSGAVTLNGEPLPVGSIQFLPEAAIEGVAISGGDVIKDGRYRIPREQGLTPGAYKVVILSHKNSDASADAAPGQVAGPPPELIPPRYNVKTTLTADVTADGSNVFNFDLKK